MASGQQVAAQNLKAFLSWSASKSDDDFCEYVHRGKLKRSVISAECGFGKSALIQNPAIKSALEALEARLKDAGVLADQNPAVSLSSQEPPMRDREAKQHHQDSQRLNSLEFENASLRTELNQVKALLERYKLMSSFLEETGRLPR
ncbi:VPA1267 family protein [Pseudomonas sp. AM14(2022)]|uniref:VPA1267 family protein n=1 Tax=Pseudomonas sp. AM14(2022) TaxID=2983371 RepID=UPI002E7FF51C|nr:VPA1267 family protein [Pseudomonas sp. AM14(2022)]